MSTPNNRPFLRRLAGHSFLEVLVSLSLFGLFTLILLELSVATRSAKGQVNPVVSEWVTEKYLEIRQGAAKYNVVQEEALLITDRRENGVIRVFGRKKNEFLSEYRIQVEQVTKSGTPEVFEVSYALLTK